MQNKLPQTIGEIMSFFDGISFHGIDLSWALCDQFWNDYAVNSLHNHDRNKIAHMCLQLRYPFLLKQLRHHPNKPADISQADVILLSAGVQRSTLLSYPILVELHPNPRLIVFTCEKPTVSVGTNQNHAFQAEAAIPTLNYNSVPYSLQEWMQAVNQLWIPINRRTDELCRAYNFDFAYKIINSLCDGIATILRAEAILKLAHPKLVFTIFDRQSPSQFFIQAARQQNIQSVTLVHGLQRDGSFSESQWAPLVADRVIVWGEWMQSHFEKLGVPAKQISIGGYPRLITPNSTERETAILRMKASNWNGHDPVVLYISSSLNPQKSGLELFRKAQACLPQYYFMVRPHPQEPLSWYENNYPGGLARVQNPQEWTLSESLAMADIVTGNASTACLDAMLIGKPVILLQDRVSNYQNFPMLVDAVESKAISTADTTDKLVTRISSINHDNQNESAKFFIQKSASCLGHEAACCSAAILKSILEA